MDLDKKEQSANIAVAEHLYRQIERMGDEDIPGLTVWGRAADALCSDLFLKALRPSGGVNILLGDFVGHGLPAAVGSLPVAEVFYGMTAKGFGLSDIITEINKKLLFIFPEELFCAACLIELDQEGKMLAVWNGGLPDLLVVDSEYTIKHRVSSEHIPLGVQDNVDLETEFIDVSVGDKVFWCSDGVLKAKNSQGGMWGQSQIDALLSQGYSFADITEQLSQYMGSTKQVDDLTFVELDISAVQKQDLTALNRVNEVSLSPAEWQVDFSFSHDVLKHLDLVPLVVNILMQVQAPYEHKQRIYTVLAEMCSNALEHGILKLDSSLKQSANGFAEYYALRSQRLAELKDANMKISLQHQKTEAGGQLTICVEDSGEGFDYQRHAQDLAENKALCGRGEGLLQQLCHKYFFSGKGNVVTAVYRWTA